MIAPPSLALLHLQRRLRERGVAGPLLGLSQTKLFAGNNEHSPFLDPSVAKLPPFLRMLLVTDGTVTRALESYFWEPVAVDCLHSAQLAVEFDLDWLDLHAGDRVIVRRVQLRGQRSARIYAYAHSLIRLGELGPELQSGLASGTLGVGEVIRSLGLESFRELVDLGHLDHAGEFGGPTSSGPCVHRSYRILLRGAPGLLVSECFPLQAFA